MIKKLTTIVGDNHLKITSTIMDGSRTTIELEVYNEEYSDYRESVDITQLLLELKEAISIHDVGLRST